MVRECFPIFFSVCPRLPVPNPTPLSFFFVAAALEVKWPRQFIHHIEARFGAGPVGPLWRRVGVFLLVAGIIVPAVLFTLAVFAALILAWVENWPVRTAIKYVVQNVAHLPPPGNKPPTLLFHPALLQTGTSVLFPFLQSRFTVTMNTHSHCCLTNPQIRSRPNLQSHSREK